MFLQVNFTALFCVFIILFRYEYTYSVVGPVGSGAFFLPLLIRIRKILSEPGFGRARHSGSIHYCIDAYIVGNCTVF
jgi:hypothetical protein